MYLQASNYTGFFEHLIAPGHTIHHFSNDLHDLEVRSCDDCNFLVLKKEEARLWLK